MGVDGDNVLSGFAKRGQPSTGAFERVPERSSNPAAWEGSGDAMQPVPGTLSAVEVLEIRDGQIVRGELFYDAEDLRKAMAQGPTG